MLKMPMHHNELFCFKELDVGAIGTFLTHGLLRKGDDGFSSRF